MSRTLLSGNEAVAQGAWAAGASVGAGYPGTPSTEALESFARKTGVYAEWAPNEKVALEVVSGASFGGARAIATMKHVGLNVAADPLFTLAYTGVGGGIVIFVADDPGMHSSQNEQDSRNYAAFARVPLLEPSDSQEALYFTKRAFEISEEFDIPVLVRSTVRLSHAKGLVETGERRVPERDEYQKDLGKWVMMPAMARCRRADLDRRVADLAAFGETTDLNSVEIRDRSVGIVCGGVVYEYVREALPEVSVLKLGMTFPLPPALVRSFAEQVDTVYTIEEADPYLDRQLRQLGIEPGTLDLPAAGELSPGAIRRAFGMAEPELREPEEGLPARPPMMCPGCPHRPVFATLRKLHAVVTGDIGCYTLGALPPLSAMDSCVCMGASLGMAHGMSLVGGAGEKRPVVGVIGDSTFAHSGVTGLMDMVYNGGNATVVILDNRITAMTGHQGNPINGVTLQNRTSRELELEPLVRALGVEHVRTVDPHEMASVEEALREAIDFDGVSVLITRAPCALLVREHPTPYAVDVDACTACGVCIRLGCPAISKADLSKADIDVSLCVGCGQCVQVCRYGAIVHTGPACDLGDV
ncbi:MAG: indolepyruvate ferredoxin oxidoreductase subunit alpha [Coriobacteriales bacterium]|nr:indolepyruvate ferredoxin oxidoreductase subunit alpha [Coriobacteriales bacterium]